MKNAPIGHFSGEITIEGFCRKLRIFKYTMHNLVMDRLITYQLSGDIPRYASYIYFGDGSTPPTSADTNMTHKLWEVNASVAAYTLEDSLLRGSVVLEGIVPATASYVGSIREVGVYSNQLGLATHALIVDAEDNPITIEKDDLLELKVRYTIYWTAPGATGNMLITALPAFPFLAEGVFPGISGAYSHTHKLYVLTTKGTFNRTVNGHKIFFGNEVHARNVYGSRSWDSSHRTLTFQNVRIPADAFNTMYFEHLALGLGIAAQIEFPNSALMEPQTLEGMNVGQGDGQTASFSPPLSFWVEDSEKIYVDDVLQVAGVDYTCDFYNNFNNYYALLPTSSAVIVGGHVVGTDAPSKFSHLRWEKSTGTGSYGDGIKEPEEAYSTRMCPYNQLKWARPTTHVVGLTATEPLIFELLLNEDPAKDFAMDQLVLEERYFYNWTARLSCSDDGETWEVLGEQAFTDRGSSQTPRGRNTFTFTSRVKRFWKIEYVSGSMPTNSSYENINTSLYVYGRRTGQNIIFTNPPAAGAVIKMDAQIDRPFKNNMHVFDFNPVLTV